MFDRLLQETMNGAYSTLQDFQDANLSVYICTWIFGLLMAYGIGANDVANTFSTSVGSKTLTLRQAVFAASVCEMVGAILLSKSVTDTVRKKMINVDDFENSPEMLMYVMFSALVGASLWLITCSYTGHPVSTTHSIIGGIIGAGCSINYRLVAWDSVLNVVISWVTSPLLSAVLAGVCFCIFRTFILRHENALSRVQRFYPLLLFICYSGLLNVIAFKNSELFGWKLKKYRTSDPPITTIVVSGGAFAVGAAFAIITYALTRHKITRIVNAPEDAYTSKDSGESVAITLTEEGKDDETKHLEEELDQESTGTSQTKKSRFLAKAGKIFGGQDVHKSGLKDQASASLHANSEQFPAKVEETFKVLQVVSACLGSVAHGSNDVANALGPIAAVYIIFNEAAVSSKTEVPGWLPVVAAFGIALGCLTFGYNVMTTIGVRLTKVTVPRGFSIEMGTSVVIIMGSLLGLPLSTTHCQVGGVVGVGACESKFLGGKFVAKPAFTISDLDVLTRLAKFIDAESGVVTEEFTFLDASGALVTAHKGWKLLSINSIEFSSSMIQTRLVEGGTIQSWVEGTFPSSFESTIVFRAAKSSLTGVHWHLFGGIIASWVLTLVFAGLMSAAVCSIIVGVNHPLVGDEAMFGPIDTIMWDAE